MCKPNMTVTIFPDLLLPVATCESIYLFIVPTDLFNINFTFYTFLFLFFFIFLLYGRCMFPPQHIVWIQDPRDL